MSLEGIHNLIGRKPKGKNSEKILRRTVATINNISITHIYQFELLARRIPASKLWIRSCLGAQHGILSVLVVDWLSL